MGKVINVQMDEDFYNEIIQGGGSGSGSGNEESIVKYYEVNASAVGNIGLGAIFTIRKGVDYNGNQGIGSFVSIDDAVAVAYMPTYIVNPDDGELKKLMTIEEVKKSGLMDIPEEYIVKEITEDEFYNLEA